MIVKRAGKTTTMRMILGLGASARGSVTGRGRAIIGMSSPAAREAREAVW